MCDDWYDPAAYMDLTWVRARRSHTCCACRETIEPGTLYHVYKQLLDGQWSKYKHCARCWQICESLWNSGAEAIDLELNCGEVWENPPEAVAALAFTLPEDLQAEPEREYAGQLERAARVRAYRRRVGTT